MTPSRLVLLTGATGFVGSRLWPRLEASGYRVRGLSRRVDQARHARPNGDWIAGDVDDRDDVLRALEGATTAFFLVHAMAGDDRHFRRREVAAAQRFASAAAESGLERIVYLGGMAPPEAPSEHLKSRLEVGDTLRSGRVPALELRASMIVGHGSLSWLILRDLAARLPFMILPRWLRSRTEPVGIDDVVAALLGALTVGISARACFDIPGPEALSGRDMLERTALLFDRPKPWIVPVPFLTPELSSHWVRLVTRADWSVAREVVLGLTHDLLARDAEYWTLIGRARRATFEDAAGLALAEERRNGPIPGFGGFVERSLHLVQTTHRDPGSRTA